MPSFIASVFLKKAKKSQMTEYIDIALSDLVFIKDAISNLDGNNRKKGRNHIY